jgi:hypothetical protein
MKAFTLARLFVGLALALGLTLPLTIIAHGVSWISAQSLALCELISGVKAEL